MSGPRVVSLGCRLNTLESEIVRREASAAGVDKVIIVNTCAVTAEAVRQARQTVRRLRREHPERRIVVTGCAAQLDPGAFAAMPEVDRVLGNADKLDRHRLAGAGGRIAVSDIMAGSEPAGHPLDGLEGRTRGLVQIQSGCDHRCTFCIIPFARGPSRSLPPGRIVEQVRRLIAAGYSEVVLTGVDICSYGRDRPEAPGLGGLVEHILASVPELRRLRLSSLDPAAIDARLFAVLAAESRLMPHLHFSLQAADDMVLKRMRRRHTAAQVAAVAERARAARPDVVLGADLIAGFPTESEEMFARTVQTVDALGLTHLHVFPFSPRRGTPAARMPQVPPRVRRRRAALLRQAGAAARRRLLQSRIGTVTEVLVERACAGGCEGLSPHYLPVHVASDAPAGTLVRARITAAADDHLLGEVAS